MKKTKSWREENIEHYREYQREYRKNRIKQDPEFRKRIAIHNLKWAYKKYKKLIKTDK